MNDRLKVFHGQGTVKLFAARQGDDFTRFDHDFTTEAEALLTALQLATSFPGEYQIGDDKGDVLTLTIDVQGRITNVVRGEHLKRRKRERKEKNRRERRNRTSAEHSVGYRAPDEVREEAGDVRIGTAASTERVRGPGPSTDSSICP